VIAIFWVLAPLAAASGFMVFRFNSMARATIALLVSFLASGALLILLGLGYLGVVVILMMVMEMIIMAVFMIAYMMNPAGLMSMSMTHNKPRARAISRRDLRGAVAAAGGRPARQPDVPARRGADGIADAHHGHARLRLVRHDGRGGRAGHSPGPVRPVRR
jgi:NADH-quinone oxidoreductase subunit J